jgi:hypothetical protein
VNLQPAGMSSSCCMINSGCTIQSSPFSLSLILCVWSTTAFEKNHPWSTLLDLPRPPATGLSTSGLHTTSVSTHSRPNHPNPNPSLDYLDQALTATPGTSCSELSNSTACYLGESFIPDFARDTLHLLGFSARNKPVLSTTSSRSPSVARAPAR